MRKQPPLLSHCRAKPSLDNARSFFIILVTVRENSFFGSLSCKQFVALKIVLNSFQIRECINVWAFLNCLVWKQLKTPQRWVSLTTNACLIYLLIKLIRVLRETHGSWVFLFFKRMILKKQHPPKKEQKKKWGSLMIRHEKLTPPIVMQRFGTNISRTAVLRAAGWVGR